MSEPLPGVEDLTKLKLSDLKKICKENKLPSTGTKTELISRLTEVQGNKFVILQPGDEAELLGDSNDGDSTDVSSITQTTTDLTSNKSPTDDLDFPMTSPTPPITAATNKISSKKRRASEDLNPEDILSVEKKVAIEPVSSATATVASIGVDHPTVEGKDATTAGLSDAERLALRAKRFGGSTSSNGTSILSDSKLIARAKRFGLPINTSSIGGGGDSLEVDELGKLKQRAERFGQTTNKTLEKLTELERKAKRLEKFGGVTTVSKKTPIDDELAKTIRAQKFGLAPSSASASTGSSLSEAERLAKRQMRFGLVDSKT